MVDYIADYAQTVVSLDHLDVQLLLLQHNRRVVPSVEPGWLRDLLPPSANAKPESYEHVMHDFEQFIMPGVRTALTLQTFTLHQVTHWQHPRFHAYFPAANSYPSLLATMLSDALGANGFSKR